MAKDEQLVKVIEAFHGEHQQGMVDSVAVWHRLARQLPDDADGIVEAAYDRYARLIRKADHERWEPGDVVFDGWNVTVRQLPARWVVFSDHHWAHDGHKLDEVTRANMGLYVQTLDHYREDGWTVVENGDVEELVCFDPVHTGGGRFRDEFDAWHRFCRDHPNDEVCYAHLLERRQAIRPELLAGMLRDHPEYYAALERLGAQWVRLTGNHDHDLATGAEVLKRWPLPTPPDVALFVDGGRVRAAVMHGHQFDRHTNPTIGPRHGEIIAECVGYWFQGADRVWKRHVDDWIEGRHAYLNHLVEDDPIDSSPTDAAEAWDLRHHRLRHNLFEEEVFRGRVAWNYYQNDPARPINSTIDAVLQGIFGHGERREYFKFRHTDERRLVHRVEALLRREPPLLILGHTHEPRCDAVDIHGHPVSWYANSGAAGRYLGLVWGLEVVDGTPRVVSWHPDRNHPKRVAWKPQLSPWGRHLDVPRELERYPWSRLVHDP